MDCKNGSSGQWTGENIPDGRHVFIVIGTDKFGNWGRHAQHTFTVGKFYSLEPFLPSTLKRDYNPKYNFWYV